MITGERVRLRAIERDDLPRFAAWLNDPHVRRNLMIYQPLSIVQEENWYEEILKHHPDEQPLSIEVKSETGWQLAGNCGFFDLNQRDRSAEIGIFIGDSNLWGQGYGCEAMRLMAAHGFDNLNLNRIYLRVFETNQRGIRCYEKAGFRHEGRLREARFHEGRYIDMLMMSILKREYEEKDLDGGIS
jgi:RimJ/RimL family protein N-acetyltransferase